jgi:hypothetical protein
MGEKGAEFVCVSVCVFLSVVARTLPLVDRFLPEKGSKTPEATSDLARKNDKKTKRSSSPGDPIVHGC